MLIQACWRGYSLRRDLRRVLRNEHAATAIQALWRGALRRKRRGAVRKRTRTENEERKIKTHSSSIEIQKACMNVWEEYVRFDRKSRQALEFTLGTHTGTVQQDWIQQMKRSVFCGMRCQVFENGSRLQEVEMVC